MHRSGRFFARLAVLAALASLVAACAVYEPAPGYYSSGYYYGPAYYGPAYYGGVYIGGDWHHR